MFGFFKKKPLIKREDKEFQIATFRWLMKNCDGEYFIKHTQLICPSSEFFPITITKKDTTIKDIFHQVQVLAGMEHWQCKLQKQEKDINPNIAPTLTVKNSPSNPLGTFDDSNTKNIIISYNPRLSTDPINLVATFAHELAHYLTGGIEKEPPGGWDNWEFATDIAATFLGFGIFQVNSAFNFKQFTDGETQGWESSRNGYLSQNEHIYALAIFLLLKKIPSKEAKQYIKPHLKNTLDKAINEIKDDDTIIKILS